MKIPQEFDTIRPWEPEDLPEVFDRLLSNDQFKQVLAYLYPQVPFEMIAQKLKACKTNLDFQYEILSHEAYQKGDTDTHFIPTYFPQYCKE